MKMINEGWSTRGVALFPAGNVVRNPHHREFQQAAGRIWTCAEPEFRLWWMKLYSSYNHYTTSPRILSHFSFRQLYFGYKYPQMSHIMYLNLFWYLSSNIHRIKKLEPDARKYWLIKILSKFIELYFWK